MDNFPIILGGIAGLFILSFGIYRLVLAPEDTTADVYRTKESIDPLKKSLTGVGYESELPSESKLHRLENRKEDPEEEDDEIDLEDDDDEDDDFDESKLLAELTGSQPLKDTSEDEESEPEEAPKKKAVKKKVEYINSYLVH